MYVQCTLALITESQWKTLFKFINETCSLRPETFIQSNSSEDDIPNRQGSMLLYIFMVKPFLA